MYIIITPTAHNRFSLAGNALERSATTAHRRTNSKPENGTSKPVPYKRTPNAAQTANIQPL